MTIEKIEATRDELHAAIEALTNEDKRQAVLLTLSKQLDEVENCLKAPPLSIKFSVRTSASIDAAKGMSQEDLAEKAGIKRTYIGSIERGEVDPRLETVSKVAHGLGVEAFKLLLPASEQLSYGAEAIFKK